MEAIKIRSEGIDSVTIPLTYVNSLFTIVKQNTQQDRSSVDVDFLKTQIKLCVDSTGEAILPPLLEVAQYLIKVIKSKPGDDLIVAKPPAPPPGGEELIELDKGPTTMGPPSIQLKVAQVLKISSVLATVSWFVTKHINTKHRFC